MNYRRLLPLSLPLLLVVLSLLFPARASRSGVAAAAAQEWPTSYISTVTSSPTWTATGSVTATPTATATSTATTTTTPTGSIPSTATATPTETVAPTATPTLAVTPTATVPPPPTPTPGPEFLTMPYYGGEIVTSVFDHMYPTYSSPPNGADAWSGSPGYPTVVRYDGQSGTHFWYNGHDGWDYAVDFEPLLAAASGKVIAAGWQDVNCHNGPACGLGLHVCIDHEHRGIKYRTCYGHMSAVAVSVGQFVSQGQIIGTSGNTGNSTGPHLHFNVRRNYGTSNWPIYRSVDPYGWEGSYPDPWAVYKDGALSEWLWLDGVWLDGDWAGSPKVAPQTANPTILDESDNGFSQECNTDPCTGIVYETGSQGYHNNSMRWTYLKPVADYSAAWQPDLPPGAYEVFVFIPSANASSRMASYVIRSSYGEQRTIVDQYGTSAEWLNLGLHTTTGSGLRVTVNDYTGETTYSRTLGIDAVKFVPRLRWAQVVLFVPILLQSASSFNP